MDPDSDDTCGPGGNHRDSKIDCVGIRDDNRSDLEEPCRNPRPWQCSICTHENDTSYLSCELCGVLRDLSLYSNNASEVEDGAKHTNKHSGASVLAISLFTPSSAKSKVVVFSDGFQANKNATGNMQTTLDALYKTYMTHKQRRVVKLGKEVRVEEFATLKALGRVFLRSQGNTIAVGIVARVREQA